ncbi:MAG: Uncharacterized protein AWU57_580 [Marinobacter sp. T13-3]|nr:MAG: Uncharacterized protein AWU57_580 [Marinobacter sp. T13-3]
MHRPLAHLIFQNDGTLTRITIDTDQAQLAEANGHQIVMNATTLEVLEALAPRSPILLMNDHTWHGILPELHTLVRPTPQSKSAAMPATPPDLPPALVDDRLATLKSIFDPSVDLASYLKLAELDMAHHYRRQPWAKLFTARDADARWHHIYDLSRVTPGEVRATPKATKAASSHLAFRIHAIANLAVRELDYALQIHNTRPADLSVMSAGYS